jgi:hypothetical protein
VSVDPWVYIKEGQTPLLHAWGDWRDRVECGMGRWCTHRHNSLESLGTKIQGTTERSTPLAQQVQMHYARIRGTFQKKKRSIHKKEETEPVCQLLLSFRVLLFRIERLLMLNIYVQLCKEVMKQKRRWMYREGRDKMLMMLSSMSINISFEVGGGCRLSWVVLGGLVLDVRLRGVAFFTTAPPSKPASPYLSAFHSDDLGTSL